MRDCIEFLLNTDLLKISVLAAALKLNSGLRELYLSDNNLGVPDAMQLGTLLRANSSLQLLDIRSVCQFSLKNSDAVICVVSLIHTSVFSNNNIQDAGVGHISDGLAEQSAQNGAGLVILILWNNHLTRNVSKHFARTMVSLLLLLYIFVKLCMFKSQCVYILLKLNLYF